MMKVGVLGCMGRMGQMLVRGVCSTDGCELSGGVETSNHPALEKDVAAACGLKSVGQLITDNTNQLFLDSDVVIDFTKAVITDSHADLAAKHGTALVLGTTGHNNKQISLIHNAAKKTPIVKAMNFSIGINILLSLTKQLAGVFDDKFDIEILEMHHKDKIDAPSGTALALGQAAASGRGVDLDNVAKKSRVGISEARKTGEIGFASLRGGTVVGEHSVMFAGSSERVEICHSAESREIFSNGAIRAAKWVVNQKPGLYDMMDVLDLKL